MELPFYKYQGTGNDFVMIDDWNSHNPISLDAKTIAQLCDRRFGIGADGLIILRSGITSDFAMDYYNADGHPGSMCGNGGRCVFKFARDLGYVDSRAHFDAMDGVHEVYETDRGQISLQMKAGGTIIEMDRDSYELNTGSPHYVRRVADVQKVDAVQEGRAIRNSPPYYEEGINVNFISLVGDVIHMKTYERGVEDETYSCGTGVTAAALVAISEGWLTSPVQIVARGGELEVSAVLNADIQRFEDVWLTGPAFRVFRGVVKI